MRGRNNDHCNVFCSSSLLLSCKKEKISLLILKEFKNSEQNPEMFEQSSSHLSNFMNIQLFQLRFAPSFTVNLSSLLKDENNLFQYNHF